jgi:hypothetical protein
LLARTKIILFGGTTSVRAPTNTVAPVLSGTPTEGQTLSCTTGTWTGTAVITYAYQWYRAFSDGAGGYLTGGGRPLGAAIGGATSSTYVLVSGDVGSFIFCTVTASNGVDSAAADSNVTATPVASSEDAATTAWVNAVVADGGAVSSTQRARVDALIVGLKADSLWTALDRLWLYAGESDAHQAKIDLVSLQSHTLHGSPAAFGVGGYTGDGSTFWVDSGFTASTGGHVFALNSGMIGIYEQTNITENKERIGSFVSSDNSLRPREVSGFHRVAISGGGDGISDAGTSNACWVASRTASNLTTLYRNGSSVGTSTGASAALETASFAIFGRQVGGSADILTNAKLSAAYIGGGLDATKTANLTTRLNTYMTAWGVNVF